MHTIRLRYSDAPVSRVRHPLATKGLEILLAWQDRAAQRRALAELDDRLLKDIGLTRADVDRECAKPFWRP
jgi:uncharacterized protein YjiS (DUF1127 family)